MDAGRMPACASLAALRLPVRVCRMSRAHYRTLLIRARARCVRARRARPHRHVCSDAATARRGAPRLPDSRASRSLCLFARRTNGALGAVQLGRGTRAPCAFSRLGAHRVYRPRTRLVAAAAAISTARSCWEASSSTRFYECAETGRNRDTPGEASGRDQRKASESRCTGLTVSEGCEAKIRL